MRFSESCKHAMDFANGEAHRYGHAAVESTHLLLSFLQDKTCSASAVLQTLGVDTSHLRRLLGSQLSEAVRDESRIEDLSSEKFTIGEKRIEELVHAGAVLRVPTDVNRLSQTPLL